RADKVKSTAVAGQRSPYRNRRSGLAKARLSPSEQPGDSHMGRASDAVRHRGRPIRSLTPSSRNGLITRFDPEWLTGMTFLETHFEPKQPEGASERALCALASRQHGDGAWEGEVVWCTMITAQVVIARAIVGCPNETAWRAGVRSYLARQQNPDGGWGLHPLASSRLFTTTLSYVALRLLGEPPDGAMTAPALAWIHRHPEGVAAIPSWGKLWLAFLDLYPYDGITPVPPELFLLPRWAPLRPDQLYCHTRYIYLAIAALMGRRFRADLGPLRDGLREELYGGRYAAIDFARYRTHIAETDLYVA